MLQTPLQLSVQTNNAMRQLNYKSQGDGPALILIHGLFGDMNNLGMLARELINSGEWQVIQLDVRNHGRSFHSPEMDYPSMAEDIIGLMDELQLSSAVFIGHSMGGKIAMQLALSAPQRVSGLIVADIAPVAYASHHQNVFAALSQLETQRPNSRKVADQLIQPLLPDLGVRQFLLKNLVFTQTGMKWRMNLAAVRANYAKILDWPATERSYNGPTLFIKGADSDYILPHYQSQTLAQFPAATAKIIGNTGHWLHAEKPRLFNRLVAQFLRQLPPE